MGPVGLCPASSPLVVEPPPLAPIPRPVVIKKASVVGRPSTPLPHLYVSTSSSCYPNQEDHRLPASDAPRTAAIPRSLFRQAVAVDVPPIPVLSSLGSVRPAHVVVTAACGGDVASECLCTHAPLQERIGSA